MVHEQLKNTCNSGHSNETGYLSTGSGSSTSGELIIEDNDFRSKDKSRMCDKHRTGKSENPPAEELMDSPDSVPDPDELSVESIKDFFHGSRGKYIKGCGGTDNSVVISSASVTSDSLEDSSNGPSKESNRVQENSHQRESSRSVSPEDGVKKGSVNV